MPTTDRALECETTDSSCSSLALAALVPTASFQFSNTVNERQPILPSSQTSVGDYQQML